MSYLLALDAGTGSIRAVIFDLSGHQVAVGQAEWKHLSVENVPGSMEFDLTTNWLLACQCIRQALANAHLQAGDSFPILHRNIGFPRWPRCERSLLDQHIRVHR